MVTGGIITWLIRLGDWIRDLTARGSKRAIADLMEFQGRSAWLLVNGSVVSVPAVQVAVGDLVVVYPGEMIPVDGEVVDGDAMVDQKTITGEGLPVPRGKGEMVFAATALREGQVTIRATRVGIDTVAGQIAKLVDTRRRSAIRGCRTTLNASPIAWSLPTLGLAFGTAAVTADFQRFLSLVIIDYGTGIRVAAPTSVLSSMTYAARTGIIIKSGGHMERLAQVDTIVFDKTGTLTHGVPEVIDVLTYQNHLSGDRSARSCRRGGEPLAASCRRSAACACPPPRHQRATCRRAGLQGWSRCPGSDRWPLRTPRQRAFPACKRHPRWQRRFATARCWMSVATRASTWRLMASWRALIPYADKIRPESRDVVRTLHEMGIRNTVMLTGDNATVANAVGERIGLTRQFADMMPAGKAEVIAQLQREGNVVAMVGDGINNSVALTYSDVGIAMRHGARGDA